MNNINQKFLASVLLFWILIIPPCLSFAVTGDFSGSMKVENQYTLAWKGNSEQIHFIIQAKTKGWVALGLQPTVKMKDADIIIAYYDDNLKKGVIQDCYAIGEKGPHPQDTLLGGQTGILDFTISENDEYTIVEFSRALQTNDAFDAMIKSDQSMKIMWAIGEEDNTEIVHAKKGFTTIHWSQNTANTNQPLGNPGLPIHFIVMSIGLFLLAIGIWIAKKSIPYSKKLKIHSLVVTTGFFTLVTGFFLQFLWLHLTHRSHFTVFHAWIGLAAFLSLIASFIMAWLAITRKSPRQRNWHISLGMAAAIFALIAAILGKFLILN
jgi:hypothetical protein